MKLLLLIYYILGMLISMGADLMVSGTLDHNVGYYLFSGIIGVAVYVTALLVWAGVS